MVLKADMQRRCPGGVFEAPFAKLAFLRPRACIHYGFCLPWRNSASFLLSSLMRCFASLCLLTVIVVVAQDQQNANTVLTLILVLVLIPVPILILLTPALESMQQQPHVAVASGTRLL